MGGGNRMRLLDTALWSAVARHRFGLGLAGAIQSGCSTPPFGVQWLDTALDWDWLGQSKAVARHRPLECSGSTPLWIGIGWGNPKRLLDTALWSAVARHRFGLGLAGAIQSGCSTPPFGVRWLDTALDWDWLGQSKAVARHRPLECGGSTPLWIGIGWGNPKR